MNANKQMLIILLGAPGAGKGTQAGILKDEYKLLHVSTGDMLREAIKECSDIGKEAQSYMNKGELVPDAIVTKLVIGRISKPDASKGVILDGYPRTLRQAESLDESLNKESRKIDTVLYFSTTEKVVIQRLSGRRVCPKCGYNYHITNIPPKKEGICDTCGVALIQREDDKPETVKNRLVEYDKRTKDLIDYYRGKGILREVDGDLPAAKLFENIDAIFKNEGLIR
jgi:adenylate kinase